MCVSNLVNDLKLRNELHAHLGNLFVVKAVMQHRVFQTLIDLKVLENVFTYIGHHDFAEHVRDLGRKYYREPTIVCQLELLNPLE